MIKIGNGLLGLVFVVFLALKLAEVGVVADWSWWWVTAPLWGGFALFIICVLIWIITLAVIEGFNPFKPKQRW